MLSEGAVNSISGDVGPFATLYMGCCCQAFWQKELAVPAMEVAHGTDVHHMMLGNYQVADMVP